MPLPNVWKILFFPPLAIISVCISEGRIKARTRTQARVRAKYRIKARARTKGRAKARAKAG